MFPRALLAFFNLKVEVWRCNAPLGQRMVNEKKGVFLCISLDL